MIPIIQATLFTEVPTDKSLLLPVGNEKWSVYMARFNEAIKEITSSVCPCDKCEGIN